MHQIDNVSDDVTSSLASVLLNTSLDKLAPTRALTIRILNICHFNKGKNDYFVRMENNHSSHERLPAQQPWYLCPLAWFCYNIFKIQTNFLFLLLWSPFQPNFQLWFLNSKNVFLVLSVLMLLQKIKAKIN